MSASIVARCDTTPVLELGEEILDFVALAVERFVVIVWDLAAAARRDARLDASGFEFFAEPDAVVAAIGDQA